MANVCIFYFANNNFMILAKHEKVAKYLAKTTFFQNKPNFKFNPIHVLIFFKAKITLR